MKKSLVLVTILVAISWSLTGCSSYYRVIEPGTGKVYYTKDLDHKSGGAITFKDKVTMREITLQQSEVMKIKKAQFKAAGLTRETE